MTNNAERQKEVVVNKHKDHIASCLCCEFCKATFEEDLSDVTAGRGWVYSCSKGLWDETWGSWMHENIGMGAECKEFLERQPHPVPVTRELEKFPMQATLADGTHIEDVVVASRFGYAIEKMKKKYPASVSILANYKP